MKRVIVLFALLVLGLSAGFAIKLRAQRRAALAPVGSSAVIEGTEADVVARISARIVAISVDEGARVRAGQLLVQLDCREQQASLQAAQAQLAAADGQAAAAQAEVVGALAASQAARATASASGAQSRAVSASRAESTRQAARIGALQGEGGATAMELDRVSTRVSELDAQLAALQAQQQAARGQAAAAAARAQAVRKQAEAALAAVGAARANVQRAQTLVEECELRAPIDGLVQTRAFEPGELALPGSRILTLVRLDPVEAVFFVPNRELAAAAAGKRVTVRADAYPGQVFAGTIRRVAAQAEFTPRNVQTREDRDRLVYAVTAELPNASERLRPGMPVEVTIDGSEGGAERTR